MNEMPENNVTGESYNDNALNRSVPAQSPPTQNVANNVIVSPQKDPASVSSPESLSFKKLDFWEKRFNLIFIILICLFLFMTFTMLFPFLFDLTHYFQTGLYLMYFLEMGYFVLGVILIAKNKNWKWIIKPLLLIVVSGVFIFGVGILAIMALSGG